MSKQTRYYVNALFLLVLLGAATAANAQVDQQRAQAYFKEARALCERDGGRLWGVSICAPMVIADRRTQTFATSQPAPEGDRPRLLGLMNAPLKWGGATWVAYVWDDVAHRTPRERNELFLHELFHGVQAQLGLTVPARTTEHLDAVDGRYWLRLEWRALARALRASGEQRNLAVRDALAFRQARRLLYPASVEDERGQEISEGLAAYTGTVLAAPSAADAIASAIDLLANTETAALEVSFVRSFAYMSGPAYGLLLDAASPGWTRRVRGTDDLGTLAMRALAVQPATDATASAIRYGGAGIRASEQKREQERQERIAELRRRFVDGPVLLIPGGSHSYDTRGAVVIPGVGTVYFGPFRASGGWGTLEAEKGVLVASDGRSRRVPAPVRRDDATFTGDGWTFKVAAGWVVREGARRGDYEVVRQQPEPTLQPSVTRDVVYGHKDGLALTLDVHRPARPNGAGVIAIVSGAWQSSVEISRSIVDGYLSPLLNDKGFTVFAVRHGSSPRYPLPAIVADVRRSVRFIRQHAGEYGVDPNRIGVFGASAGGHLALLLGTTADSGDPSASDVVLRASSRVAAVAVFFPPTDLSRFGTQQIRQAFAAMRLTDAEAAEFSPIRFVSPGDAPSLIVHGDADTLVPMVEGETMHAALTKGGVPASFIRIEGAGHGFGGADLERVNAAMVQWFERHLRGAAK